MKYRKILIITLEYPPFKGGVARYTEGFVSMFSENDITVLVNDEKETRERNVIRKRLLFKYVYPRWIRAFFVVRDLVRRGGYDLLITPHILPLGLVCRFMKRYYGIRYLISLHGKDILTAEMRKRKKRQARSVLRDAYGIIVNSTFTKSETARILLPDRKTICILHPSPQHIARKKYNSQNIRKKYSIHKDAPVLLTVGRLVKRKGIDIVLDTLKDLVKKYPDIVYMVIGTGKELVRLENQARRMSLQPYVRFITHASNVELSGYYSAADLFVLPARRIGPDVEGFGTVFLEAGLFSLPVIGTKTGGIKDAVIHEKTGLLIQPGSVKTLYAAIDRLLTDTTWRETLGANGKVHAHKFTWEHNKQFFDIWFRSLSE